MNGLKEIESAVRHLPPNDLANFRAWFAAYDAEIWDLQLDDDISSGRLDALAKEAIDDNRNGNTTER